MTIRDVDRAALDDVLATEERPVLVDFWADWCGPCRAMEPVLRGLADEGDVAVVKIDADDNPDVLRRYDVRGLPTVLVFSRGELAGRLVGARNGTRLRDELAAVLAEQVTPA